MAYCEPMVLPLLFTAMAIYVGWITLDGFRSGAMEPITKGLNLTAKREAQPVWFWTAAIWNGSLVGLCLWGAVGSAITR
jgi:hypothetical protein